MPGINSIEELMGSVERLSQQFDQFGNQIGNANDSMISEQAIRDRIKRQDAELHAKLNNAVGGTITGFVNFGKSVSDANGNFTVFNSVINLTTKAVGGLLGAIPVIGGALKGLAEGTGEAAKFMMESFTKAYNSFEQLSDSGVVASFTDLKTSSYNLGLTFADVQKVLSKNSKELSMFGGSTLAGRKEFEKIGKASEAARAEFQRLGISAADFSEYQLNYISQQTKLGNIQGKSVAEIAQKSQEYAMELDLLTKMTGVNRKEMQAQRDAALSETRFRASMMELDPDAQERSQQLNIMIQKSAPALAQGFRDLMSGAITTDAAKQLVLQSGGAVEEVIEKLKAGTIDQYTAFRQLGLAVGSTTKNFAEVGKYIGDQSIVTKDLAQAQNMHRDAEKMSREELVKLAKNQKETRAGGDELNKSLADTKVNLYNTGREIDALATSSKGAAKAMEAFSKFMKNTIKKINDLLGIDLEGSEATGKKVAKAQAMEGVRPEMFVTPGGAAMVSQTSGKRRKKTITDKDPLAGLNLKSSETTAGGEANPKLLEIARNIHDLYGGNLTITALNDLYHKENSPNSKHNLGLAMDFVLHSPPRNAEEAIAIKKQLTELSGVSLVRDEYFTEKGPKTTGPHFHVEVAARNGALIQPKPGGTIVQIGEAGQSEAIVPLPDGKSIPVTMNNSSDQTLVMKLVQNMNDKFDTMIDLLAASNSTQRNIAQNLA